MEKKLLSQEIEPSVARRTITQERYSVKLDVASAGATNGYHGICEKVTNSKRRIDNGRRRVAHSHKMGCSIDVFELSQHATYPSSSSGALNGL